MELHQGFTITTGVHIQVILEQCPLVFIFANIMACADRLDEQAAIHAFAWVPMAQRMAGVKTVEEAYAWGAAWTAEIRAHWPDMENRRFLYMDVL